MAEAGAAQPIKDILNKVIAHLAGDGQKKERLTQERINLLWEKAAGRASGRRSKPVSLRKGRLLVNVGDSSLLYDLTLRKKQILEALMNEADLKGRLKEIQFRIGETGGKEIAKDKGRGTKRKD